jgi:hypothetical protein
VKGEGATPALQSARAMAILLNHVEYGKQAQLDGTTLTWLQEKITMSMLLSL